MAIGQARAVRLWESRFWMTRYQTHRERFSPVTSPAFTRIFMWWLIVGWDRPDGSTRSQAQTSPPAAEAKPGWVGERGEGAGERFGFGGVEDVV